jgi:hypothetical protein
MRSAATLALLLATAAPAAAAGDSVTGSARNHFADLPAYPVSLSVSAHGFDSGLPTLDGLLGARDVRGNVTGAGTLPNGDFVTKGEVTCLRVVGNRATIKYRFTHTEGEGAPSEGWGVQVFIEDNGPPGHGVPDANATDLPMPAQLFDPQADVCELPRGPFNPVDDGNYVVRDR